MDNKQEQEKEFEQVKYQEHSVFVDGKEHVYYEYKKDLDLDENKQLIDFLSKVENGLKNEEGMDGVLGICKSWKKECQSQSQQQKQ